MSEINYQSVQEYLATLVPPREPELQKMEEIAEKNNFPIIGPACGYYCYQLARIIKAKSVFELGSGYGYSTAWFAKAVKENGGGVVHHTVWDEDLSKLIDNMIWSGRVYDSNNHEKNTEAIRRFTRDITSDLDWIVSLIPARDGMIVAYKK